MKRIVILLLVSAMSFGMVDALRAQDPATAVATDATSDTTLQAAPAPAAPATPVVDMDNPMAGVASDVPMHEQLKIKFIEGGPEFMGVILILLILGLSIVIERIIYLNLATTNTQKLLSKIESSLDNGGVEVAMEVCRNTRGPVASIFYQGLSRSKEGIDVVEKAVGAYGSVQLQQLESGLTWVSLFIALAPMFGFMGTVIGMISAFDAIEIAGDIAPSLVAGGIKIALITTVFGLIVAAILQIFYNYILNKIDTLTMSMEDASISLVDILVRKNVR